jgi:hypothetical protein
VFCEFTDSFRNGFYGSKNSLDNLGESKKNLLNEYAKKNNLPTLREIGYISSKEIILSLTDNVDERKLLWHNLKANNITPYQTMFPKIYVKYENERKAEYQKIIDEKYAEYKKQIMVQFRDEYFCAKQKIKERLYKESNECFIHKYNIIFKQWEEESNDLFKKTFENNSLVIENKIKTCLINNKHILEQEYIINQEVISREKILNKEIIKLLPIEFIHDTMKKKQITEMFADPNVLSIFIEMSKMLKSNPRLLLALSHKNPSVANSITKVNNWEIQSNDSSIQEHEKTDTCDSSWDAIMDGGEFAQIHPSSLDTKSTHSKTSI